MYRYILSSDSVISKMESNWYKNLEKNRKVVEDLQSLYKEYGCSSYQDMFDNVQSRVANALFDEFDFIDSVELYNFYSMDIYYEGGGTAEFFVHSDSSVNTYVRKDADDKTVNRTKDIELFIKSNKNVFNVLIKGIEFSDKYYDIKLGNGFTSIIAKNSPVGATYLTLCRTLVKRKGEYLLKDDKKNTYYKVSSVGSDDYTIRMKELQPAEDGLDLNEVKRLYVNVKNSDDMLFSNTGINLPTDGTCPTIVSRDEALPQKKLF